MSDVIDLHLHSSASDGDYDATELAQRCAAAHLAAVALTDHNSTRNVAAAQAAFGARDIELIAGCEISTRWRGAEHHLLALWVPLDDAVFAERIERVRRADMQRSRAWVANAEAAGYPITWERIETQVGVDRVPPFAVIATMLLGDPPDPRLDRHRPQRGALWAELFAPGRELGAPAPYQPDLVEAIAWVREGGGVPVLAHPGRTFASDTDMEEVFSTLVDADLAGVEAWTPHHAVETSARFHAMARSSGLAVSAGADFHGPTVKPWVHNPGQVTHNSGELLDELRSRRRPPAGRGQPVGTPRTSVTSRP